MLFFSKKQSCAQVILSKMPIPIRKISRKSLHSSQEIHKNQQDFDVKLTKTDKHDMIIPLKLNNSKPLPHGMNKLRK